MRARRFFAIFASSKACQATSDGLAPARAAPTAARAPARPAAAPRVTPRTALPTGPRSGTAAIATLPANHHGPWSSGWRTALPETPRALWREGGAAAFGGLANDLAGAAGGR